MYGPSQLIVIWLVLQETRGEGEREKTREEGEDIPVHRGVVRFLPACSFVHAPGRQDTHELLAVPSVIDTCLCFVTQYSQPVTDVAIVLLDTYITGSGSARILMINLELSNVNVSWVARKVDGFL